MLLLLMITSMWLVGPVRSAFDLFPHGPQEGDVANPQENAGCGEKVTLDKPFPFYGKLYHQLWVCNNGILSFVDGTSYFQLLLVNNTFIALFAEDIDISELIEDGNKIYWRLETDVTTLKYINWILKEHTPTKNFAATWSVIVTYYKVGYNPQKTDLLNTFQLVMACDDSNDCACLLIYADIQWTQSSDGNPHHGWAGFRDAEGNQMLLPDSGTAEVANWPDSSNVGIPGLFVYRVNQSDIRAEVSCNPQIAPFWARIYFDRTKFRLRDFLCHSARSIFYTPTLPKVGDLVPVAFIGKSFNVTITARVETGDVIKGQFPYWGKTEAVHVVPLIDGIVVQDAVIVNFVSPWQLYSNQVYIEKSLIPDYSGKVRMDLRWPTDFWEKFYNIEPPLLYISAFSIVDQGTQQNPYKITAFDTVAVENIGSSGMSWNASTGSLFFVIDTTDNENCIRSSSRLSMVECGTYPLTSKMPEPVGGVESCSNWYSEEVKKLVLQKPRWHEILGDVYGCPWNTRRARWVRDFTFGVAEVRFGSRGWQPDPCCVGRFFKSSNNCPSTCPLNPGAYFCIQSPGLRFDETDLNGRVNEILMSNQCCYNSAGNLLRAGSPGAGFARKMVNSDANADNFVRSEVQPYWQCCEKESECQLFHSMRPVTPGVYRSTVMRIIFNDPILNTFDGFEYSFNPLKVLILTQTLNQTQTDSIVFSIQVSTRRLGNGTVFSGFVVKDQSTTAEFFQTIENETIVFIKGTEIDTELFLELEKDGVHYKRNETSTEFVFKFLNSNLTVKAMFLEMGILAIAVAPPMSTRGNLTGLMGNFDGVAENDLLAKNGNYVSTNSSWATIHNDFGETWAVQEEDWMFSFKIANLISKDIQSGSPYTAKYTAEFESDELKAQAEEICGTDEPLCTLDVALTGNIELAHSFKAAREMIEEVELLNEVAIFHLTGGEDETTQEPTLGEPAPGEPKNDGKKGETSTVIVIASSIGAITCCVGLSVVLYWGYRRFTSNFSKVEP